MTQIKTKRPENHEILPKQSVSAATGELSAKPTNQTLVEFPNRNAVIPEWRLKLQNAVRQRQEREMSETETVESNANQRTAFVTNGATALKAETIEEPQAVQIENPTLNSALERIEKSRRRFLVEEKTSSPAVAVAPAKANKNYPFYIAAKTNQTVAKPAEINPPVKTSVKPKLAAPVASAVKAKLDTNKLPPLPQVIEPSAKIEPPTIFVDRTETRIEEEIKIETKIETKVIETEIQPVENVEIAEPEKVEEFDDCAPFAMRFNAGLFDLIIGSFTSLFLLSPFMLTGSEWLSTAGLFAFLAVCAVVMFIYTTATVGLYGKTFGMRLFSLEVVDIETDDYPTFHQAAVSTAVYLLSMALGGIGFLSIPFNPDRRAIHDIVSGTIVVKE